MSNKPLISVVTPVLNEVEVIELFYDRVRKAMDGMDSTVCEFIFVDDGSKDGSYEKLVALAKGDADTKIIKFSRNFGHQVAITAGIDLAKGDAVVVIDADLQDPPEVIKDFVAKWQEGYDVVYGVRDKRDGESKIKLLTAAAFYRLLQRIIKLDIPVDVGDFRLMSRRVVDSFKELKEKDRFVRGLGGANTCSHSYGRNETHRPPTKTSRARNHLSTFRWYHAARCSAGFAATNQSLGVLVPALCR